MDLPLLTKNQSISAPEFKQSIMFTVDSLRDLNSEMQTCVTQYEYPKDHPFVKGHFPGIQL